MQQHACRIDEIFNGLIKLQFAVLNGIIQFYVGMQKQDVKNKIERTANMFFVLQKFLKRQIA